MPKPQTDGRGRPFVRKRASILITLDPMVKAAAQELVDRENEELGGPVREAGGARRRNRAAGGRTSVSRLVEQLIVKEYIEVVGRRPGPVPAGDTPPIEEKS